MTFAYMTTQRMTDCKLITHKYSDGEIELDFSRNFDVRYQNDNNQAVAVLEYNILSKKNPDELTINVAYEGVFDCVNVDSDEDKITAHIQMHNQLFPYLQSYIANCTLLAGLNPLMLKLEIILPEHVILTGV